MVDLNQSRNFLRGADYPPLPGTDNPAWRANFGLFWFCFCQCTLLVMGLHCYSFFMFFSWTCVYAYLHAIPLMLFTGGSKPTKTFIRRSRARYLKPTAEGKFIDETEVSRAAREAERMAEASKKTKRTASRKGKQSQPNYKAMDSLQYATIR